MRWAAIIVAAGRGARFGRPKQLMEIAGLPMVGWSMETFAAIEDVHEMIVATEPESVEPMRELLRRLAPSLRCRVVRGGARRQDSAREALRAASDEVDAALIHDGARPLVTADDVRAGMRGVRAGRATLLAEPVVDTIKIVDAERRVSSTVDRSTMWSAQTPQFAALGDLLEAHNRALRDNFEATDDATLLERIGVEVSVVPATTENFKVTAPSDLARAEALLKRRARLPVSS